MVSMKVPKGYKMVTRFHYDIPDTFSSVELVRVEGREWWQFWLPRFIKMYVVLEEG